MQKNILNPGRKLNNNRYEIIRLLGSGGFGKTYISRDLELEDNVVIKEYYPVYIAYRKEDGSVGVSDQKKDIFEKGKDRFLSEAKTLASLFEIEAVVKILDFFEENGTAYMVMELVNGLTLRTWLERNTEPLSFRQAFDRLLPIMDSLEKIHEKGIIHRDISPDNIMVQEDGSFKLLDFGSAREFFLEEDRKKTMSVILKNGYAPPEQYEEHGSHGPWIDVYSLCVTLYEMITGYIPESATARLLNDSLYPPSAFGADISAEDEDLLMKKGLALGFSDRFSSMKEMKEAFYSKEIQEKSGGRKLKIAFVFIAAAVILGVFLFSEFHDGKEVYDGNYTRDSKEFREYTEFIKKSSTGKESQLKTGKTESGTIYNLDEKAVIKRGIPANRPTFDFTEDELKTYLKNKGCNTKTSKEEARSRAIIEKYGVIRSDYCHIVRIDTGRSDTESVGYGYDVVSGRVYFVIFYLNKPLDTKQYRLAADFLSDFGWADTEEKVNTQGIVKVLSRDADSFMKKAEIGKAQKIGNTICIGIDRIRNKGGSMSLYLSPTDPSGSYSTIKW